MAEKKDFYSGENLEALLTAVEDNLFDHNEDINAQIDEVADEMKISMHKLTK